MTSNTIIATVVMVLILFRVATRIRKNIGRQRLNRKRLMISIVILGIISCALVAVSSHNPLLLMGLGAGLLLGAVLALVGLRLTKFEHTAQGQFYTPNAYIGVALSVVFVGRLLYRLFLLSNTHADPTRTPTFLNSPLSIFIVEVLAGYYVSYYVGLLTKNRGAVSVTETTVPVKAP